MNVSQRKKKRWDFNESTNLLVSKFSKMEKIEESLIGL
jgi:hypothetical protein